ncbi:hypothetical protein [Candidatus Stoquefichus massiliensis]|uniref:hypothetical protein n=1 Tax=Candidatus Stoquefichus massiliensis TaxID=1470350 RepID=UPI000485A2EF|nr:hypothetical protein [Candidatus Stoquefichus massiliensis]
MRAILDALNFEVGNPYDESSEVHVHFEYERLSESEVKFFLHVYVGIEEIDDFRFYLKMIYIIDCEDDIFENDDEMIEKSIHCMIPTLTQMIITLDNVMKEEGQ